MAEMEKRRFNSSRGIRLPMMVLLPLPLGAEKMINLPAMSLHHVKYLLLDLFQLILHPYHEILHLGDV